MPAYFAPDRRPESTDCGPECGPGRGAGGRGCRHQGAGAMISRPALDFQSKHWVGPWSLPRPRLSQGLPETRRPQEQIQGEDASPASCQSASSDPTPRWASEAARAHVLRPVSGLDGQPGAFRAALSPSLSHTLWCVRPWLWRVSAGGGWGRRPHRREADDGGGQGVPHPHPRPGTKLTRASSLSP